MEKILLTPFMYLDLVFRVLVSYFFFKLLLLLEYPYFLFSQEDKSLV